jgi:hypothetical protein
MSVIKKRKWVSNYVSEVVVFCVLVVAAGGRVDVRF